jgi:hypothetical protein
LLSGVHTGELYDKTADSIFNETLHAFSAGGLARLHENSKGPDAQL